MVLIVFQMKKVYPTRNETVYFQKISLQLRPCHSWLQCCKLTVGKYRYFICNSSAFSSIYV